MPRVSVVSGFYNRARFLQRTVSSVLNQTFGDFDLVVFDDKSTDGTADRLATLSELYSDRRFRYTVHPVNVGFVHGLRAAIDSTDSEFIAIQGSGDASLPQRLERQVEYLDTHPLVAAVGGWYYNVQEGQGTRVLRTADAEGASLDDLVSANIFSHGEVMIRRRAYERVGGYRTIFKYAQDRDLWLRLARAGYQFGTVRHPVYERYVQFDGVSYVPSKLAQQACYSIAAERLVRLGPEDENVAVGLIARKGIEAYVPLSDRVVQGKLFRAALRTIVFGEPKVGAEVARKTITQWWMRAPVRFLSGLYGSPLGGVVRWGVGKTVGLRTGVG